MSLRATEKPNLELELRFVMGFWRPSADRVSVSERGAPGRSKGACGTTGRGKGVGAIKAVEVGVSSECGYSLCTYKGIGVVEGDGDAEAGKGSKGGDWLVC